MKRSISKNLLDDVKKFADTNLNRKDDLQLIVDQCVTNNLDTEFEELVFTGKYIEGLKRVLSKGAEFQEVENLDHVKKDLTENMGKIIEQLRELFRSSTETTKILFETTYLSLTPECFGNLNELLADLEWIKKYLNFQKRSN